MSKYRVGIILSTTYVVDAENEDEAEDFAREEAESDYPDLNIEEANFVEKEEDDDKNDFLEYEMLED